MATATGTKGAEAEEDDFEDEEEEVEEDDDPGTGKKGDEEEEFDKDRALATIKAQRASEKKVKDELKTLRAEMKELKDKDLPASEKLQADKAAAEEREKALEVKLQKSVVRTTALEEASKLGFKSPALAHRLIDMDDVDWDDEEPTNIKSLLKEVLVTDPYLKAGRRRSTEDDEDEDIEDDEGADAGRGRRSKAKGFSMNREIRRAAGRA